jgi:hypothetical protein
VSDKNSTEVKEVNTMQSRKERYEIREYEYGKVLVRNGIHVLFDEIKEDEYSWIFYKGNEMIAVLSKLSCRLVERLER